jgi:hypothetical protein
MKVGNLFETDMERIKRYKSQIEEIKKKISKDGDPWGERQNEINEIKFHIHQEENKK